MVVNARPNSEKTAEGQIDPKLRQFIHAGGSPATSKQVDDGVKFTLPIPGKLLARVEQHRESLPIPTKRIQWILQAIAEKLDRDGY